MPPRALFSLNEQIVLYSEYKKTCDSLTSQCDSLIPALKERVLNTDNIVNNQSIEITNLNKTVFNLNEMQKINKKKQRKNIGYLTSAGIVLGTLFGVLIAR